MVMNMALSLARFTPTTSFSLHIRRPFDSGAPRYPPMVAYRDRPRSSTSPLLAAKINNTFLQEGVDVRHRPLAHFPPDIWGDRFDNFTQEDILMMDKYTKDIELLKDEVRIMLMDNSVDMRQKMSLINTVERLGFPYYFEKGIEEMFDIFFKQLKENDFKMEYNLCDTASFFRMFRQHGYNIPSDVFNKFINNKGKIKESLKSDERGMLSLYEAAHLRIHDEDILEEALVYTTEYLKSIVTFSEEARLALKQPLHRGNQRLQSQQFIKFYEQDLESRDEKLLQLAKLEFNRLQLLHCQELSQIQKWCKDLDLAGKFPHLRQRHVECHYISTIVYYEPQYSYARILFAKSYILLAIVDDIYDAFGTFEELGCLTDAFERWDLNSMEMFTEDYMKTVYEFVINTFDDVAKEMTSIGKPYAIYFAKCQSQKLIRDYFIEAKWVESRHVPTYEEYMVNGKSTASMHLLITLSLMGMEEVTEVKPYIQLMEYNKATTASSTIGRLMDDMATGEAELARGVRLATSVECYMKDYNMSKEEVLNIFQKFIDDSWKDLVDEGFQINPSPNDYDHLSKPVYNRVLNLARAVEAFYRFGDGLTFVKASLKEDIVATYCDKF